MKELKISVLETKLMKLITKEQIDKIFFFKFYSEYNSPNKYSVTFRCLMFYYEVAPASCYIIYIIQC